MTLIDFRFILRSALIVLLVPGVTRATAPADGPQTPSSGATATATAEVSPRKPDLHPKSPAPISDLEIQAAIERGVAFLIKDQNVDGSWGSPERTKGLNITAGIGSHHAFRTAVTALCVSALIEISGPPSTMSDPGAIHRAIERGEEFLFRELPLVRRDSPMLIYNVWGARLWHLGPGSDARPFAS